MFDALAILVVIVALALPAAVVGLPWTIVSGDIGLLYRWTAWIVRAGLRSGHIHVSVSGREKIPPGRACIFMANHISNLDPAALFPLLPFRTAFIVKRQLFRIPFLGTGMRLANFIPVARDGRVESARASVDAAKEVLAYGVHVFTFPEGTRSRNGRLQEFKKGPFYLAVESGAPVVPISVWGTWEMMAKGSFRIRPGTAHVVFHEPIDPTTCAGREELAEAVHSAIASTLPEWMRMEM